MFLAAHRLSLSLSPPPLSLSISIYARIHTHTHTHIYTHIYTHTAAAGVSDAFGQAQNDDNLRLLKISIEDEAMVISAQAPVSGDFREDWDATLLPLLEDEAPCYILYRMDTKNSSGYDFTFIAWSPDFAHVRQKMLYSSTRATLKQTFGSTYIKDELFGTVEEDITLEGYDKHRVAAEAPAPLTAEEVEKAEIRAAETGVEIGASTKHTLSTGVAFPLTDAAMDALTKLKAGGATYVQLSLDTEQEIIDLALSGNQKADDIAATIPDSEPRYSVFRFKHNHEGDALESVIFCYSCPGYSCSIKQRMLYSTCKSPLVDVLEDDLKIELAKKLEIGEGADFTHDWLYDQLHPAKTVFKAKFARPARPGKGSRRPTRRPKPAAE